MRAVLDTNVWVSAMLAPDHSPARILEFALNGKVRLVISPGIITEIRRVMQYPKVKKAIEKRKITSQEVEDVILKLLKVALITPGALLAESVSNDPADDMVIACAVEAQADFIISCDHHLTDLENYQRIKIVNPAAFLALIANER
ncbi:MAG: putative toxin-antitoxin system toxin component, PIN family [Desulfobaccales bacterium]